MKSLERGKFIITFTSVMKKASIVDDKTIQGCFQNNGKCQELVFKTYYSEMLKVCSLYTSDPSMAKDLLQEGFIKVFSKIEKYRYKGSFDGWVKKIMTNTAIDYTRKKMPQHLSRDVEGYYKNTQLDIDISSEEEEELNLVSPQLILDAIQTLPPQYKAVFNMFVIEGYMHKEIAEVLGIGVGTSKSNLHRAKVKLKKQLLN